MKKEDWIEDVMWALTGPIIVWPGYEHAVPEWIMKEIPLARMTKLMKNEEPGQATDLEAVAYLMTASLIAPMPREWEGIYLWAGAKALRESGKKPPEDIAPKTLSEDEKRDYRIFKEWLFRKTMERKRRPSMGRNDGPGWIEPLDLPLHLQPVTFIP